MIDPPGTSEIGARLTIAMRDSQGNYRELLGVLHDESTIRKRDGSLITFDPESITHWRVVTKVVAKAGFGAPLSMRIRELEGAAAIALPADITEELGRWVLRASQENILLRNSVLPTGARPFGEPGIDIDQALRKVTEFYHRKTLLPAITVPLPAYSKLDEHLEAHGWILHTEFNVMVIDTSEIPPTVHDPLFTVKISQKTTSEWLPEPKQQLSECILRSPAHYLSIMCGEQSLAHSRISIVDGWGVITHLFVTPEHRRQGLGRALLHELAGVAHTQGCSRLTLRLDSSDSPALAGVESLGFRFHHRDRCRVLPET